MRRLRLSWIVNCPRSPSWTIGDQNSNPDLWDSRIPVLTPLCPVATFEVIAQQGSGERPALQALVSPVSLWLLITTIQNMWTADWPECLSGLWLYSSWVSCALCSGVFGQPWASVTRQSTSFEVKLVICWVNMNAIKTFSVLLILALDSSSRILECAQAM